MPTYDYECLECKSRFEMFQRITEEPIDKCIKCGGKVKRLISAGAGIIFKGSGFYVNDYKKNTGGKEQPKKSTPSGESSGNGKNVESPTPAAAETKKTASETTASAAT